MMTAAKTINSTAIRSQTTSAGKRRRAESRAVTGFSRPSHTDNLCIKDEVLLDPACGSGKFPYRDVPSPRELENRALGDMLHD